MGFHPDTFRRQSETAIRLRQAESLRSIATDLTGPLGNERPFVLQGPAKRLFHAQALAFPLTHLKSHARFKMLGH